jgi:hypothetical protein
VDPTLNVKLLLDPVVAIVAVVLTAVGGAAVSVTQRTWQGAVTVPGMMYVINVLCVSA